MNLTSFLANKCFEYLLKCGSDQENANPRTFIQQKSATVSAPHFVLAPPWAVKAELFKKLCDGCGECLSHCEKNILILNKEGYPAVDFSRGSCSFCGACARNCPSDALRYDPLLPPWNLLAFITGRCLVHSRVLCSTCVEHCDKGAINLPKAIHQDQLPVVLAEKCNGCGACFSSCPVHAIAFEQPKQQVQP